MSVMAWNISGLQNPSRARAVAHYLKYLHTPPELVGLMETRGSVKKFNFHDYKIVCEAPNLGLSGGITVLSRRGTSVISHSVLHRRLVRIILKLNGCVTTVYFVYGSHKDPEIKS